MTDPPEATTSLDQWSAVIARAATDQGFRSTLLNAPAATLQSAGVTIPAGTEVRVVENSATLAHLVVPGTPAGLSADAQQQLASLKSSGAAPTSPVDAFAKLVIDSWSDGNLKTRLLSEPAAVLAERGIAVPAGINLRALEATGSQAWLVLPPPAATSVATAQSTGPIAASSTASFSGLAKLITAGSYLGGVGFSIGAIIKFKQHKDNPTQVPIGTPIGTPIALVFIAAALIFLPPVLEAKGAGA